MSGKYFDSHITCITDKRIILTDLKINIKLASFYYSFMFKFSYAAKNAYIRIEWIKLIIIIKSSYRELNNVMPKLVENDKL